MASRPRQWIAARAAFGYQGASRARALAGDQQRELARPVADAALLLRE